MSRNLIIAVAGLILFTVLVAYFTFRTDPSTSAAPDGTYWLCSNASCKNTFNLSLKELADHHKAHYGEPVKCPKCQQNAIRGDKCPKCGTVYVLDRGAVCPKCNAPAPPPK